MYTSLAWASSPSEFIQVLASTDGSSYKLGHGILGRQRTVQTDRAPIWLQVNSGGTFHVFESGQMKNALFCWLHSSIKHDTEHDVVGTWAFLLYWSRVWLLCRGQKISLIEFCGFSQGNMQYYAPKLTFCYFCRVSGPRSDPHRVSRCILEPFSIELREFNLWRAIDID